MTSKSISRLVPPSLRPIAIFPPSFLHPSHPFSTTSPHSLATPMRSPKAAAAQRARNHPLPTPKPRPPFTQAASQQPTSNPNPQSTRWPVQMLAAAHMTGSLPLPPTEAVPFLERFSSLLASKRATTQAAEKLCQEYDTPPDTLFVLARVLLRTNDEAHFPVLRGLFHASSSLGNKDATILLITQALDTNNLHAPHIAEARIQLARLVDLDDHYAMMLQAAVDVEEGRDERAMELAEKVVNMPKDAYLDSPGFDYARGRSWGLIARLKGKKKDAQGAKQALEKAALETDNPDAYLELALRHRQYGSPAYLFHLQKAAASGNQDAASALGGYYLSQAWHRQQSNRQADNQSLLSWQEYSLEELYRLSEEWITVAIDRPDHGDQFTSRSQVNLALLLRRRGEYERGRELLGKAMQSGDFGRCVGPWIRERWNGEEDDLAMSKGMFAIWTAKQKRGLQTSVP